MWILTREHNDYDQHGDYYVKAWCTKPTIEQVDAAIDQSEYGCIDLKQVYAGGGRIAYEDVWHNFYEDKE